MRRLTLVVLVPILACQKPAPKADTALADSLAAISRRSFVDGRLPGLAVGVLVGDSVVYRGGFGVTADSGSAPITPATVFHMASVTKPFVATAVMQLVEGGQVSLDSALTTYLPDFRMKDPRAAKITVRQLLNHVAGMPDVSDYRWGFPEYDDASLARYVKGLADSTLIAAPGEKWQYSNIGFEVLAHLIATVSKMPFETYVQQRILSPLGMRKSTLLMTDIDSTLMTRGHSTDSTGAYHTNSGYPYNRRHAASSTLHSNIDDMLRWASVTMHKGTLAGTSILKASSYDEMWRPERDLTEQFGSLARANNVQLPFSTMAIGLSWFIVTRNGHRVIEHSGGDTGFRTDLLVAVDDSVAVVVLSNGDRAQVGEIAAQLLDAAIASRTLKR